MHILIHANFETKKWHGMTVKRGQILTSVRKLASDSGLSEQQTKTALSKLQTTGEITSKATNKYTILTIENYDFFQARDDSATHEATNEQPTEQQTNNQQIHKQITTTKELKKKELKKKDIKPSLEKFEQFWAAYPEHRRSGKAFALKEWKKIKPTEEMAGKIISAMAALSMSAEWTKRGGQFVPKPAKWLAGGGWDDAICSNGTEIRKTGSAQILTANRTIRDQLSDKSWAG